MTLLRAAPRTSRIRPHTAVTLCILYANYNHQPVDSEMSPGMEIMLKLYLFILYKFLYVRICQIVSYTVRRIFFIILLLYYSVANKIIIIII